MGKVNLSAYGIDLSKVIASITKETAEYYPGLKERLAGVADCLECFELSNAISSVMAAADITGHNIGYIDEVEALEFLKSANGLQRAADMLAGVDFNGRQNHYHLDDAGNLNTITPTVIAWSVVELVENVQP